MIYAATNEDCTKCITADYTLLACTNSTKDTIKDVSQELAMKCTCQQSFNEYASCFKCPISAEHLKANQSPSVYELIINCAANGYTGLSVPK
ncbi:9402_t:CDS:2 [Gigaspora rosea]|nr:9402_t:CDS:2 [Gigaspora rosea]